MNWNCRICNVEFVRDEVCVTCGAEKLYDATVKNLETEIARLKQYESTVRFIANDYVELSYEKAQWQRDDWYKRCRKTITGI